MSENLLEIKDLVVDYPGKGFRAKPFRALKGVSLDIREGETVGLVGESGSGKTTIGRAVLGLTHASSGSISYRGSDVTRLSPSERRGLGTGIQAVFQDPYSSLNPSMSVEDTLCEPLIAAGRKAAEARARVAGLLDRVALPANAAARFPHEFSGGQRQRVAIARALAGSPSLVVCDEPVSALDLSTQATVLDLLIEIQNDTGLAYMFISHDLNVVRHISHRVSVIHRGEIVESGDGEQVTSDPAHPYTRRLLMAVPVPHPQRQAELRLARQRMATA